MLGVPCVTQVIEEIRSSVLRQLSDIKNALQYAKLSKIRWARHVMHMNDNRGHEPLVTRILGMSNVVQVDHRPDVRSFSWKERSAAQVCLERAHTTGLLLHTTGSIGRNAFARSTHWTINEATDDRLRLPEFTTSFWSSTLTESTGFTKNSVENTTFHIHPSSFSKVGLVK